MFCFHHCCCDKIPGPKETQRRKGLVLGYSPGSAGSKNIQERQNGQMTDKAVQVFCFRHLGGEMSGNLVERVTEEAAKKAPGWNPERGTWLETYI